MGSLELDPQPQKDLTSAEERRRIISLDLLAMLCLMQPWRLLAVFATRACFLVMVNLVSTRTPRALSAKQFSSQSAHTVCTGAWGCFSPSAGLCISPY